jgi:outer membrane protein X
VREVLAWLAMLFYFGTQLLIPEGILRTNPITMKNLLAIVFFSSILSFTSKAQESEYKPFKVDVSLGYAIPGGKGAKGGVLFAIEPKYSVINSLAVGLRMEGAIVARFSGYDENGDAMDASVKASGSYLATGDYYIPTGSAFRPFTGAGAGIFSIASVEINSTSGEVSGGSKFGGMVRTGFEISHFRFGFEYNIVPKTKFDGFDENGNPTTGLTSSNSYMGIKIGACIGGGRKK